MVKELIKYPTPLSVEYGINVRVFDEKLFSLIDDLKDTINENNLKALSAFQIGSYLNVIVLKNEDGSFLELINPKVIAHSGEVTTQEKTTYYDDLSANVVRHEKISVIYQNRAGENQVLKAEDDLAITLQRKIDYTFGSTFLNKLSKEEKKRFEESLEFGSDIGYENYCPTTFFKDKIIKFINITIALLFFVFLISFFIEDKKILSDVWQYELYTSYFIGIVTLIYIVYGRYEGLKYKTCTSCQIGNILGTAFIAMVKLSAVMTLSYIFVK
ncbi:peptide deformylase [Sulfurimonas marina]|uniref:Peptide deformylase n=1 Tax=Sulfurimonas marina TaxID=2590551 RepID=A0A7M1ATU8_9BACT|nr:peptide deformylase [Sulfurimonas marina]QOP40844.1 peptide deformylase [Sulfurimonas marina]